MSYSYYLLHGLTLKVAFSLLAAGLPTVSHETLFFVALMPLMFAATLVPAAVLFLFVERPLSLSTVTQPERTLPAAGLAGGS